MKCRFWLLIFGLVIVFTSKCELTPQQPFTPQMVVHCLLRAGENRLEARVNQLYQLEEVYDSIFPGAEIRVVGPGGVAELEYGGADRYRTFWPIRVREQDTWFLQVAKIGFDTVRAKTLVPGGFEILFPRPGDTVSSRDSMVWIRSRYSKGYYLSFRQVYAGDTFYIQALIPNDSFGPKYDSLFVRIPNMLFLLSVAPPPDSPPKACTLRVWALDTNYYDWVLSSRRMVGRNQSSRLTGGVGVFGSVVERELPLWVRADTGAGVGVR